MAATQHQASIDPDEVAQFDAIATDWWDPKGQFAPLHAMNPTRLGYIRDGIVDAGLPQTDAPEARPLDGVSIADIGCGGGLLSEPMARMGAQVTGIDASEAGITVAKAHVGQQGLDIDYRCCTAEALASEMPGAFDAVTALEIVEHVADVDGFLASLAALVRPGGRVFLSTLNRTPQSFAVAIVGAEYVARLLPRGTHDWRKFVRPDELKSAGERVGLATEDVSGMFYTPMSGWHLNRRRLAVNYITRLRKL